MNLRCYQPLLKSPKGTLFNVKMEVVGVMLEEDTCKRWIICLYSGGTFIKKIIVGSRGTYIRGLIEKGTLFGIRLLTRLVSRYPMF